jgi:hypothetical protein
MRDKSKFIRDTLVNGTKYDVYEIFCVNNKNMFESCGFDLKLSHNQKYVATFTGPPTDDDIVKIINLN